MNAPKPIDDLILTLRGQKVILAADLADVYEVEPKVLNQAIKRNAARFPMDFCFQLSVEEFQSARDAGIVARDGRAILRSQFVTLRSGAKAPHGAHAKYPPMAFTEHGALMVANILKSPRAAAMSVYVIRAFVKQRELIASHADILKRLAAMDQTLLQHDEALRIIWKELQPLINPPPEPPRRKIGFQV